MRTLEELLSDEPAWPLVQRWIAEATNAVEVLSPRDPQRGAALTDLQVTTRSTLGAVVYESGGLLVDGGWLRVLGSGNPRLPRSVPGWNQIAWSEPGQGDGLLLVADDVLGGFFALNGGALDGELEHVHYFAPDTLEWESLERGYTDFLAWAFKGDLDQYYEGQRWSRWQEEVARLPGDEAFSFYPPLSTAGPSVAERTRSAVPVAELLGLQLEMRGKLGSHG
jgi:hypothetical protein